MTLDKYEEIVNAAVDLVNGSNVITWSVENLGDCVVFSSDDNDIEVSVASNTIESWITDPDWKLDGDMAKVFAFNMFVKFMKSLEEFRS